MIVGTMQRVSSPCKSADAFIDRYFSETNQPQWKVKSIYEVVGQQWQAPTKEEIDTGKRYFGRHGEVPFTKEVLAKHNMNAVALQDYICSYFGHLVGGQGGIAYWNATGAEVKFLTLASSRKNAPIRLVGQSKLMGK